MAKKKIFCKFIYISSDVRLLFVLRVLGELDSNCDHKYSVCFSAVAI
jgi:hypothetical protein